MKRIAVFTATRAEYGLLRPVLQGIQASADCELQLLVSGTHLSPQHGHTLDAIVADGFCPAACMPLNLGDNSPLGVCHTMGQAIGLFAEHLVRLKPDCLVLLGDRYETFAMAAAAHTLGLHIAHIHGGETTEGAIDDAFRHAITHMSNLHFTACEAYRQRVIHMGKAPETVYNAGSLGVESTHQLPLLDEPAIRAELGLEAHTPYFVCTFHPETLGNTPPLQQIQALCEALEHFPGHATVFTGANADAGGDAVNAFLQDYVRTQPRHRFRMSLGQVRYFSAVRFAACVVGNSSSGVIEVPSLGTPVVDIGDRQKGRARSQAVWHCAVDTAALVRCLEQAMQERIQAPNPYERQGTAALIVQRLREC